MTLMSGYVGVSGLCRDHGELCRAGAQTKPAGIAASTRRAPVAGSTRTRWDVDASAGVDVHVLLVGAVSKHASNWLTATNVERIIVVHSVARVIEAGRGDRGPTSRCHACADARAGHGGPWYRGRSAQAAGLY